MKPLHALDVPSEHITVSGTAAGDMTILAAPPANYHWRVIGIDYANDAANVNAVGLKAGASGAIKFFMALPANDSKSKDLNGKVWDLPDATALIANIDTTPTAPGQMAVSVDYSMRQSN